MTTLPEFFSWKKRKKRRYTFKHKDGRMHRIVLCNLRFLLRKIGGKWRLIPINKPWWFSLCSTQYPSNHNWQLVGDFWGLTLTSWILPFLLRSGRHRSGVCGHWVLFEYLLHHHPRLGPVLSVQLIYLSAALDNLYQYLEHRYSIVSALGMWALHRDWARGGWWWANTDRVHGSSAM